MSYLVRYKFYILAALLIILLFFVVRQLQKRRKKRQAEEEMGRLHRRNEALAEALRNPLTKEQPDAGERSPLEINWDDKAVKSEQKKPGVLMFELIELASYSRRKYVFRADQAIRIGSGKDNEMVLHQDGVAERHCEISVRRKKPCVFGKPGTRTILRRGRKTALVGEGGVYLNNGDQLELGSAVIQFRTFHA